MARRKPENYLKEWREYRGLSVETLAELARLHPGTIRRIEDGELHGAEKTWRALAAALAVAPPTLLGLSPLDPHLTALIRRD